MVLYNIEKKKTIILSEYLIKILSKFIKKIWIFKKDITISIKFQDIKDFINLFKLLKKNFYLNFSQLIDITAIDYLLNTCRFSIFYNLLSLNKNKRLFIKYDIILFKKKEIICFMPSLNHIYASSIWFEREVWDMYGIIFFGNFDLRRILTDYGFKGHPLRKDFPLIGFVELIFDIFIKTLKYVPVELNQNYRKYLFVNAWENLNYI